MNKIIFKINKQILSDKLSVYQNNAIVSVPVKSLQNEILFDLINGDRFMVDNKYQIDFIIKKKINIDLCIFGTTKSIFDLDYALKKGFKNFIISSKNEFDYILDKAVAINNIAIMVNFGSIQASSLDRFGVLYDRLNDLIAYVNQYTKVTEICFHIPNSNRKLKDYVNIFNMLYPVMKINKINKLNLGGITSEKLILFLKKVSLKEKDISIVVEPGNSLCNDAISIEARVCYINKVENFINLNIGIYSGLLDVVLENKNIKIKALKESDYSMEYKVYGPSSDNIDFLGKHILPENINIGDIVEIYNCGVYALFFNTDFYSCERIIVAV